MSDRDQATGDQFSPSPIHSEQDSAPFRNRARQRLGVSKRQWEYLVAGAIAGPYVVAIALYLQFNVSNNAFVFFTGFHSLIAMYGSYKL